ncbi:MAG: hypothetical protein AAB150_05540 [Pseudomonadota bacterium]
MTKKPSPISILSLCLIGGSLIASAAYAADADWKRGRIYYRYVCTACHTTELKKAIGPNEKTKAEWAAFIQADKHGKNTVTHYFSKQFRDSIKASNKAASKFDAVAEKDLLADVKAYVNKSAKDGDAPAGCG